VRFKRLHKEDERVKRVNKMIKERVGVNPILSSGRGMSD
jgi:hypothetical protein